MAAQDATDRLAEVAAVGEHLDQLVLVEQVAQARAHQLVVVREHDAHQILRERGLEALVAAGGRNV